MEFFVAYYSGNKYEQFTFVNRAFGHTPWAYWTMISCNVLLPQLHWLPKFRTNPWCRWPSAWSSTWACGSSAS